MNRRLICACILIAAFSNGSLRAEVLVGYIDFSLLSKDSKFAQDSKSYLLEKERVAKFNLAQEKDPEKRKKIIADYNSDFQAEFNRSMTAISRTVSAVAKSKGIETVLISDVAFASQRVNFTPHALSLLDGGSPVEIADLKNLKVGTISTRSLAHSLGAVDAQRFMMEFKGEVKGEHQSEVQRLKAIVSGIGKEHDYDLLIIDPPFSDRALDTSSGVIKLFNGEGWNPEPIANIDSKDIATLNFTNFRRLYTETGFVPDSKDGRVSAFARSKGLRLVLNGNTYSSSRMEISKAVVSHVPDKCIVDRSFIQGEWRADKQTNILGPSVLGIVVHPNEAIFYRGMKSGARHLPSSFNYDVLEQTLSGQINFSTGDFSVGNIVSLSLSCEDWDSMIAKTGSGSVRFYRVKSDRVSSPPPSAVYVPPNKVHLQANPKCVPPSYPKGSLDRGEQGAVRLRFLLSEAGAVLEGSVVESSGFPDLDSAALEALSRCTFNPLIENEIPVKGWATLNFVWKP